MFQKPLVLPVWVFRAAIWLSRNRRWFSYPMVVAVGVLVFDDWDDYGRWLALAAAIATAAWFALRQTTVKFVDRHFGNGVVGARIEGLVSWDDIRTANDHASTPMIEFLSRKFGGVWSTISVDFGWYFSADLSLVAFLDEDLASYENRFLETRRVKPMHVSLHVAFMTDAKRFFEMMRAMFVQEQAQSDLERLGKKNADD